MGRRERYGSRSLYERKKDKKKLIYLLSGIILGACIVVSAYQATVYYSTDQSCSTCHVHPHVEASWKLSKHFNNGSGTRVHCADCHLPPKTGTVAHYSAKFRMAMRDVWGYLTKDSADWNWDYKSELEQAVKYIPNESCKDCHHDLFPQGIEDDGITAHLYYEANETKLNMQCIGCHLDAGHYNPNYKHKKLSIQDIASYPVDTSKYFKAATPVTGFTNFTEQIPRSNLFFQMIAVPGGTFQMGSPEEEPFRKDDEGPVHNVTVSPFYMSEIEVTWDLYW